MFHCASPQRAIAALHRIISSGEAGRPFQPKPKNLNGTWMSAPRGVELSYAWRIYRFTGGPMITIWVLRGKRRLAEVS